MENERKATPRQLAYIQHLRKKQGKESLDIEGDLGFDQASQIISDLMGNPLQNAQGQHLKINEARLGMVLKECYRHFRNYQRDILGNHREWFKDNVIKTYQLFTEIVQELDQNSQMED
jgi:hypothetical protein